MDSTYSLILNWRGNRGMAYLPNKIRANNNLAAFKEGLKKVINQMQFSGRFRPSDKGVPGHPDPDKSGRPGLQKKHFWPFGPQFGLKLKGGGPSQAPPLDPPLQLL